VLQMESNQYTSFVLLLLLIQLLLNFDRKHVSQQYQDPGLILDYRRVQLIVQHIHLHELLHHPNHENGLSRCSFTCKASVVSCLFCIEANVCRYAISLNNVSNFSWKRPSYTNTFCNATL